MHPPLPELAKLPYLGFHTVTRMQPRQLAGIGVRKSRELLIPRLPVDFDRYYERQVPYDPPVHRDILAENTTTLRNCLDTTTRTRFRERARAAADGAPTFLNATLRIADSDGTGVDWYDDRFEEYPLLWRLKLYAFQPLAWTVMGVNPDGDGAQRLQSVFDNWVKDWAGTIEIGREGYLRRAWTPWAVSLRILHWSRYLAWRAEAREARTSDTSEPSDQSGPTDEFDRLLRRELYRNALFLRKHVEWDVGGNHLLENGTALVVAGLLFAEEEWVDHGTSILAHAADEQFLDDGSHFERSPMYHILTLTRLLTACDLLDRSGQPLPEEVSTTTSEATAFLRFLRPPDGRIPLLNDAVYGQALPLDCCLRYADALGYGDSGSATQESATQESAIPPGRVRQRWTVSTTSATSTTNAAVEQTAGDQLVGHRSAGRSARDPSSGCQSAGDLSAGFQSAGYQWLRTDAGAMLLDGGPVGPKHLPGHSHSDTLSILLWLDGEPVVTDTGTAGYVSESRRNAARGVRGHNTIQVGETEPIALGGKYLMGPRPEPTVRRESGPVSLVEGQYEAAPYRGREYTHHRAVYAGDRWWSVWDTVFDHGSTAVRSRLHLHPAVEPSLDARGRVRLSLDEDRSAFVHPLNGTRVGITTSPYFPEFGVAIERPVITLHAADTEANPAGLGFLVAEEALDGPAVTVAADGVTPVALQTAGDDYPLPETRLHSS